MILRIKTQAHREIHYLHVKEGIKIERKTRNEKTRATYRAPPWQREYDLI